MVGRIDIPTYFDQECTRFYKNIRVAVLDKAAWDLADTDSVVIDGYTVNSPRLERIGGSGTKTAIKVPSIAINRVSVDTFNRERNWQMQRLSALFNSNISLNQSVNDSYNMAFFPGFLDATYYLKNGSKIISHYTEEFSYQGNSLGRDFVYMEFVNPSGTTIGTLGKSGTSDPMWNSYCKTPTGYGYTHSRNMLGSEGMLKESAITYPGQGNTSACTYTCFYIFDDFIFHSNYYDCTTISARASSRTDWYTSADFEKWIPLRNEIGAFQEGMLYKFLGLNSSNNDADSVVQLTGGKYVEEAEDDENTYPGGGDDKNPYPEDGESGKGTFDNRNDEIDFPSLPTWDATSTGFIEIWNPNMSEILDLYTFMWSDQLSIWEKVKHWFNDPMDAIISLGFVPVDPAVSGKRNVSLALVDTGVQMNHVSKQFVEFDFGSQVLDEYYGACWDFSPYTKVQIYLPYIGIQELDTDDVMGANLHLKYFIDLLTGATSAQLKCTRVRDGLDGVVYTWEGNCLMRVPITGADARGFMSSLMQATAIGGLSLINPAAGALSTSLNEGKGDEESHGAVGQWTNPVMATYSAANVLGQKIHVQRGSRVDANVGVVSPQCAYLIINRPISGMPRGWNEYAGYPSMKIKALSTQKGFTKVAYIKLNNLEATSEEIAELDSILKDGVIL